MTDGLSPRERLYLLLIGLALVLSFVVIWLATPIPARSQASEATYTADDTLQAIEDAAATTGVSAGHLRRIVRCESRFYPYAIGRAGERGAVQLHPHGELRTFYAWGYDDPYDPYQAVEFLAWRLAQGGARAWSCK